MFVFRGRRRDLIKLLWYDGDGLCLFAKRLERGRFVWPQVASGTVALTRAQLCWFFRDSSCTPEADLHPLQMHRASVAPEPSDSARRGRARAIGACAGREVCGPLAVVSSVGSRVLGGCGASSTTCNRRMLRQWREKRWSESRHCMRSRKRFAAGHRKNASRSAVRGPSHCSSLCGSGLRRRSRNFRASLPEGPFSDQTNTLSRLSSLKRQIPHPHQIGGAAAKVKTHPTLKIPRCRTFRNSAIVFTQPKHSATLFLLL